MIDFPKSAAETRELAEQLVRFLRHNRPNTKTRPGWTDQNIWLLEKFFSKLGVDCEFTGSRNGKEFLWDFDGYIKKTGILVTAESEFDTKHSEIEKDFDRLLYGSSPLKLMICRIDKKYPTLAAAAAEAESIRQRLETDIRENCTHYPPGAVFVIYCAWWAEEGGSNRDFAYILQVKGEPCYAPVERDQHFQLASD